MSEIQKTNVCCLDLPQECIDYLNSLGLNVYVGSLGSVFTINWGRQYYGAKPIQPDINIPTNLHEYHVFICDMNNPSERKYETMDHNIRYVESDSKRHLECRYPVNILDLRPLGTQNLYKRFQDIAGEKRLEVIFVGHENSVNYHTNVVEGIDPRNLGSFSNIEGWNLVYGQEKCGKRVVLEDNPISKTLFEGRKSQVTYCRVFSMPTEKNGDARVIDRHFMPILSNESGECISYMYSYTDDFIKIVLPQVEDKVGLLKDLFENIIFMRFSQYFPDVQARSWINAPAYMLSDEIDIQKKIETKCQEYEVEISRMERDAAIIRENNRPFKNLLTESGSMLVTAVKTFLEWLGFTDVIDKDETLEEGEIKEEDLNLNYNGQLVLLEVKGINGTSTDAECSQIDKIVNRRMRELDSTNVHGIYVVNHQRNVEPLKRQTPPFNDNQIKDAENQSRTLVYTTQLFSLHSDIENGYITKEEARECFLKSGLANFHSNLISLGIPYNYFQKDTVVCLELDGVEISVGDTLYFKDSLNKLVGCKVESIQQDKQSISAATTGKFGIKMNIKVPRNRELYK